MEIILGRNVNHTATFLKYSGFGSFNIPSTVRCLLSIKKEPKKWNIVSHENRLPNRSLFTYSQTNFLNLSRSTHNIYLLSNNELIRKFSSETTQNKPKDENDSVVPQKPNIFQKMKQLTKDYWHILIPVHVATSIVWVTIFYMAAKNGVDIIGLMEYFHMPESYIDMIRNSNFRHGAVTYALYKIFTPLRYTVTVGGTTMSIRYLDKMGYLKFKRRSTEATPSTKSNNGTKEKTNESYSKHLEEQDRKKKN